MNQLTNYHRRTAPARGLRHQQTDAEEKLWRRIRNQHFSGFKFRRQFPIGPYFADFCCIKSRLIVEVDGMHHTQMREDDANRTEYLVSQGYLVLRFWNH